MKKCKKKWKEKDVIKIIETLGQLLLLQYRSLSSKEVLVLPSTSDQVYKRV